MRQTKARLLLGVIVTAGLLCGQSARPAGRIPSSYKDLKLPPLNPIKVPPVERTVLPNGLTLFLVEDRELPVVRAQALVRTGDRHEPVEKAGLADLTLRVLRTGGSVSRGGDALDKELDRMAASVETGAGTNSSSASAFALKQDAAQVLGILADLLRHPAFPQDKIDLAKIDMRDSISRRNEDPLSIHGRETSRLLYGKESPYTRQAEYATLDAITRDDLAAFHQQFFQPENVILGVWGDFQGPEMKKQVEKVFGAWPRGGKPKPGVPPVDTATAGKPGLFLVNKEDVNQSTIGMARLLGRRDEPDYHALVVMTTVLGGSFGSRMSNSIRSAEGLAYMAMAHYLAEYDHSGYWFARVGTKSETTMKALELMRREIEKMKEAEVSDEELQRAKDGILKGEAFDFDSTGKIVGRLLTYEYYGYPSDYLQRYRAGIEKVTKADVLRVARKYLEQGSFQTLVVGKGQDFDQPLTSLGKVIEVDITIPSPKSAAVEAATDETRAKGKALLDRARKTHGAAALERVKDYLVKADFNIVTPQGEMTLQTESQVNLAGKGLLKMATPAGEMIQGFDGERAWMKTPQGVQDAPAPVADLFRANALRDTLSLLRNYDQAGYAVQSLGPSNFGGREVEGVLVKNEAAKLEVKLLIDPTTGLLAGKNYMGSFMGRQGDLTESYSDYRAVEGVQWPFQMTMARDGQKAAEQKVTEIRINPGAPDDAYKKPQ